MFFIIPGAGGLLFALSALGVNYGFRRDYFAKVYVEKLAKQMEENRRNKIKDLMDIMKASDYDEGVDQFNRLTQKFDAFKEILDKKLTRGELTHARYLGMAEQVYLSVLDNLNLISSAIKSMSVIDIEYIKDRTNILEENGDDNHRELDTLKARMKLFNQQKEKVHQLKTRNEEAMTQIDVTIVAIADMRTEDISASLDMESAMDELAKLAQRAKEYS